MISEICYNLKSEEIKFEQKIKRLINYYISLNAPFNTPFLKQLQKNVENKRNKRKNMNFVNAFISFTKEYESPTSFWKWSAYALIAAVLRNNIYYEHGIFRTYPNIYVILLADSAEYRKSGPFPLVSDLLNAEDIQNTKVIQGRNSVQAIIDELSQDVGLKGKSIRGGCCILMADELASFFVSDPQLIPLITTMYDYKDIFPYGLRSGKVVVKNLCVNLLAASNETFLKEVYTSTAVYGGLLGRTFMIKPDETREPNAALDINLDNYNKKPLIEMLRVIKTLSGRVSATEEARKLYKCWYYDLYKSYKKYKDRTGLIQRIHIGGLKLGMIIMASNYRTEMSKNDIEEAIYEVTQLKANYEIYAMKVGMSDQADVGTLFLISLWEAEKNILTRREVMVKHWQNFNTDELDKLILSLETAGFIKTIMNGNDISYEMMDNCKEIFKKGKQK